MQGKPGETFGAELRRWRTKRGLSLAALAREVHYSKGYLSKIENGEKPPTFDVARLCDDILEARGELMVLLPRQAPDKEPEEPEEYPVTCPYRGLEPYGTADADWFFGRSAATAEVLARLTERLDAGGPVTVVAPSGAGKSSLLRAGVLPALARGALPRTGSASWPVAVLTPTDDPPGELAVRIAEAGPVPPGGRLVVVVDQLEEAFTLCADPAARELFLARLLVLPAALVLLGVRADFYGHLLAYPGLVAALRDGQVALGPMTPAELRAAVAGPAERAGLDLEPGLVELMLRDHEPGALPLLAHALLTTFQNRTGRALTVAGYERTGGLRAAVATTAERAYERLDPPARETARRVLLALVHVDREAGQTRRRLDVGRLHRQVPDAATGEVVAAFVRARLLTVGEGTAGEGTVELAHEAVLGAWPRLGEWIEADRAGLWAHQRLAEAAEAWHADRRPALLYQGGPLAVAAAWAADHPGELTPTEARFLRTSAREQERGARRLRRLVALLSALVVLAAAATATAWRRGVTASRARDTAVSQRVAAEAGALRASDPALAAQLAVAAYRRAPTTEARGAVLSSGGLLGGRLHLAGTDWVKQVAFSPDGALLLAGPAGDGAELRDGSSGAPVATLPVQARPAAWRPGDDRVLFAIDRDGPALLDLGRPAAPKVVARLPGAPDGAAFTSDGRRLVTTEPGSLRVWDTSVPADPRRLAEIRGSPVGRLLAVSGDGRAAVTAAGERALLWDLTARTARTAATFGGDAEAAAFAPDGERLAVTSDGEAVVVDLAGGLRPGRPRRLDVRTLSWGVAFGPGGRVLATGGNDRLVRLWDPAGGTELARIPHPQRVTGLAFGPGGVLATGSSGGEMHLWRDPLAGLVRAPATAPVVAAGGVVASVRPYRDVLLNRVADGPAYPVARLAIEEVSTVALRGDGRVLVSGDDRGRAMVWDLARPDRPRRVATLTGFRNVNGLAFAPDGRTLAVADTNRGVWLFDVTAPARPRELAHRTEHQEAVVAVAFAPDGRTLASASLDRTVRLWAVTADRGLGDPVPLVGHGDAVHGVSFAPDGRRLVTSAADGTDRVWDLIGSPRLFAVLAHPDDAGSAVFGPDAGTVVTTGGHRVRTWDLDVAAVAARVCALAGEPLTRAEWERHLGSETYAPPCHTDRP